MPAKPAATTIQNRSKNTAIESLFRGLTKTLFYSPVSAPKILVGRKCFLVFSFKLQRKSNAKLKGLDKDPAPL